MVFHRTFPISNLTPESRLVFLSRVILTVFLSYFVFPLKNKTKLSGDSKSFSKNQIFTK